MKTFLKNYGFILCMLTGIVGGCVVGLLWPQSAANLAPLGTIFTNLMFCLVVPMVYIITAATAAVQKKVTTVTPMTLPARSALGILAMALQMEQNTMGTTRQNIRLVKMVPRGARLAADWGHSRPTTQPPTMPASIHRMKL